MIRKPKKDAQPLEENHGMDQQQHPGAPAQPPSGPSSYGFTENTDGGEIMIGSDLIMKRFEHAGNSQAGIFKLAGITASMNNRGFKFHAFIPISVADGILIYQKPYVQQHVPGPR